MARQIQKKDSKVKAVITAGTPNNGAGIANSVYSYNYYNVLDKTLDKANNTINYTMMAATNCAPPVSWLIAPLSSIATLALPIAETIAISPALDSLERYINQQYRNDATLMDMRSNSAFISSLNSSSPSVPILSIYGAEDTWPLLRLLASLKEETSETQYFSYIYQADNIINQACSIHDSVYDALKWPAIIMPWIWATGELVPSSKSKWEDVGTYIDYDIHNEYSEMVGAFHLETRTYTSGWWIFKKTYTETVKVYEDHDGMITEKDAKLNKTNVKNVKVQGVNHMEMGNNYKMKEILTNALRNGTYGPEFKYSNY